MSRKSAGILPFKVQAGVVQVLLVHPGGPFWRKRDDGTWSVAKGEYGDGEQAETAARREFAEETGWNVSGTLMSLGGIRQAGGKYVTAFALEADFDPGTLRSNLFEIEWPLGSGRMESFPEVDRAEWFNLVEARGKLLAGQRIFIDRLLQLL